MTLAERPNPRVRPWHTAAAALTVFAAPVFFVGEMFVFGVVLLGTGLGAAYLADRSRV